MKKLIAGSFAFAIALVLCTNVFAKTWDITTYVGDEGLVGRSEPIGKGDVLNIKDYISQETDTYYHNDILSKGITINGDSQVDPQYGGPSTVIVDGGGWYGFYMDESVTSTMNDLDLTGYAEDVISVGNRKTGDVSAKLTLNDVDIYYNGSASGTAGESIYVGNSELNIVSKNRDVNIYDNSYMCLEYAKLNLKGNNINISDDIETYNTKINNSSNLVYEQSNISMYGESVFNNTGILNNQGSGYIGVYDNSVLNNKGELYNKSESTIYLGGYSCWIPSNERVAANALDLINMNGGQLVEYRPVLNNDGYLENTGEVIANYATINNNDDIYNSGYIYVYDGSKFNNKGDIENDGNIEVYGEFDNKGEIFSTNSIYVGKKYIEPEDNNQPMVIMAKSSRVNDDLASYYAIFDNNGTVESNGANSNITVDTTGIFNNNKTLISDGHINIYGQFNNKGKINGAYIYLDVNSSGSASAKSAERSISKATTPYMESYAEYYIPVLRNYGTIDVSEGIYGQGLVYNNGTINLGGEINEQFSGDVLVDHGTINLMKDSYYFNNAENHVYSKGTLNLVNETLDWVAMNNLYLEGDMYLKLDIDLAGSSPNPQERGDYLCVGYCQSGVAHKMRAKAVSADDGIDYHQILINELNIWSDSEKDITSVIIANEIPQEAIHLAGNLGVAYGPMYGYKVTISTTVYESPNSSDNNPGDVNINPDGGNNIVTASQDPTTGETEDEEEIVVEGMDYGNVLTFQKLKDHYSPEIEQSKVAIAGANISQEEIFDTVLNNAGNFSFFQKQGTSAGDVEDSSAPTLWIKGFGSKEDVELENYTTVKTTYYGAMIGVDWERQYSETFDATYGLFGSYIGGELKNDDYTNSKVTQNGAYLGVRANWYFGELSKFFVNGIIDYGFINNNSETRTETNDFNSQVIGLAARAGYNFEWANKSFTVQPSFGITGKYIITDDIEAKLTDESSIKEEIGNITNITYEPGLKLIKNLGRCWILTGEGKYVIEQVDGEVKVEEQVLPDTSYENYTDLGLGIEKIWGYTVLHLKANKTFGGRDGFGINAGIEFKF